ncbi:ABC transporter permease [Kutzneria sp. CA-103260]|uniref:ABC transporter permease n=1 Tax=Kutzneria sp. CA-103260 TaxID=2802641 RepID=UPI001BACA7BD|nr:ABC transporter permease subunit [Kutzneria sp. CA-103260]QUQ72389.1 ABC-2 family transporter protein [Kutzneria sp. CA-103260]
MIWVVWRQQRAQLITLLALLVVAGGAAVVLRAAMVSYVDGHGLNSCLASGLGTGSTCRGGAQAFASAWFDSMKVGQLLIIALPLVIGLFCGSPLFARELEHGTHVLAFTQSVSRLRWMASKFVVGLGPALIVVVALQLLVEWWVDAAGAMGPMLDGPYYYSNFSTSGLAPAAYTVFAFVVGMFVGAATKRTLVAMTVTLGVFVVLRYFLYSMQRHLLPTQRVFSDDPWRSPDVHPGLIAGEGYVNANGAVLSENQVLNLVRCASSDGTRLFPDETACYRHFGLTKSFVDVIPVDAAGTMHLVEAGIYVGVALVLLLATGWAVRRQA